MIGIVLPLACFLIFLISFFHFFQIREDPTPWRSAFLLASLVWGALVVVIIEVLSLFHYLNFMGVLAMWALALAGGTGLLMFSCRRAHGLKLHLPVIPSLTPFLLFLCSAVVFIVTVTGVTALVSAPNNYDSMVTHLSRVMHWIQDGRVSHFSTMNLTQNFMTVWVPFAITHFQILSGSDRFANLIQWFSLMGGLFGVSLVAREFGAGARAQIFAALLFSTLPLAILQASSTQNDLAVSFWLIVMVLFLLRLKREFSGLNIFAFGLALGLAILSKPIAYFYAMPFVLWFVAVTVLQTRGKFWKAFIFVGVVVLSLNLGFYARNVASFGVPLPGDLGPGHDLRNTRVNAQTLTSNVIRNLALQLSTPIDVGNQSLLNAVRRFHDRLGWDVSDRATLQYWTEEFTIPGFIAHEDMSSNPLHFVLILLLFPVTVFYSFLRQRRVLIYQFSLISGFLLMCALVKWSPYNTRYFLPLMALFCAPLSVVLGGMSRAEQLNRPILLREIHEIFTIHSSRQTDRYHHIGFK